MKIKMNTGLIHLFSGTYGTEWEPRELDNNGEELPLKYDFGEMMKSIARCYDAHDTDIVAALAEHAPYISRIDFPGTSYSPREYNFQTDVLDFVLTVNAGKLRKALAALKDSEEFATFLHEHYSSRDGFWSHTPDNYDYLRSEILTHGNRFEQALSALTNFLCRDVLRDIETDVYEYWSCNGYCGLNYEIDQEAVDDWKARMQEQEK